ncbi:hypothetical protein JQ615_22165 [Bradyrhizobium jicamae]|uniref:Secreted protein n=1 Tax=Bradyrhizobium jicamae TaxID=280332 RepID=A0ABS5FMX7_9BRAD|nr:hypothetical protein [Bradyrhizobium jicamae]MBR0798101.1 hypothetical protein [Bradyrhizobium jicamae]MBR0934489.1 hypothetical protein [Bradyrhizobium jicamae]
MVPSLASSRSTGIYSCVCAAAKSSATVLVDPAIVQVLSGIYLQANMIRAMVVVTALVVASLGHAQGQPKSAWQGSYQPPQSEWTKVHRPPPQSTWDETKGSRPPPTRKTPQSWWNDPSHQNPPKSSWAR